MINSSKLLSRVVHDPSRFAFRVDDDDDDEHDDHDDDAIAADG